MNKEKNSLKFFTKRMKVLAYIVCGVSFGLYSILIVTGLYEKAELIYASLVGIVVIAFWIAILGRIPVYIKEKNEK